MNEKPINCPQCGAPCQERQGKFGPFWGCSAYPQTGCRFIYKAPKPPLEKPAFMRTGQVEKAKEVMAVKNEYIKQSQDNKNDSIRLNSAARDATLILTTFYPETADWPEDQKEKYLAEKWLHWKKWLFNRLPETPEPDTKPF